MSNIPINIDPLNSFHINNFNNFYNCFYKKNICLMGCFFPPCLFGQTYKNAGFGSFLSGCSKYLFIQILIIFLICIIILNIQWFNIYGPLNQLSRNLDTCKYIIDCQQFFINNKLINNLNQTYLEYNNCIAPNNICKCLRNFLPQQCQYIKDLPQTSKNISNNIIITEILGYLFYCASIGGFLGYYRQKIAEKYAIHMNTFKKGFFLHCIPFINQCTLCQEANTVNTFNFNRIAIMPTRPVYLDSDI